MKLHVEIKQEHIDTGCRRRAFCCPGALAIREALTRVGVPVIEEEQVGVYHDSVSLYLPNPNAILSVADIPAPLPLDEFVTEYDANGNPSPVAFDLDIPDEAFAKLQNSVG